MWPLGRVTLLEASLSTGAGYNHDGLVSFHWGARGSGIGGHKRGMVATQLASFFIHSVAVRLQTVVRLDMPHWT